LESAPTNGQRWRSGDDLQPFLPLVKPPDSQPLIFRHHHDFHPPIPIQVGNLWRTIAHPSAQIRLLSFPPSPEDPSIFIWMPLNAKGIQKTIPVQVSKVCNIPCGELAKTTKTNCPTCKPRGKLPLSLRRQGEQPTIVASVNLRENFPCALLFMDRCVFHWHIRKVWQRFKDCLPVLPSQQPQAPVRREDRQGFQDELTTPHHHPNCPTVFKGKGRRFVKWEANPNGCPIRSDCRHFRMTIVIKVSDEQILRSIRQLGEEFSVQAEGWLGTPDGEGKE